MAVEDILKKIREDAGKEAAQIKKEAEKESGKVLEAAGKEAALLRETILRKSQVMARNEEKRVITMANLEARKQVLKKKQDLIADAFRKAQDKIENLSDKEYRKAVKLMLLAAVESGDEEVIVSSGEKQINTDLIKEVNKELNAKKAQQGKLKLSSEKRDFKSGFILKSGRKEINNTFESIFKEKQEVLEAEVAKILFQTEDDSKKK